MKTLAAPDAVLTLGKESGNGLVEKGGGGGPAWACMYVYSIRDVVQTYAMQLNFNDAQNPSHGSFLLSRVTDHLRSKLV